MHTFDKILLTAQSACLGQRVDLLASEDEKYISSANFPKLYPALVNCKWTISSKSKTKIKLTVYFMDIEQGPNGDCVFDILSIKADKMAWILCGEHDWSTTTMTGSEFTIDFTSDFSGRKNGFLIGYSESERSFGGAIS